MYTANNRGDSVYTDVDSVYNYVDQWFPKWAVLPLGAVGLPRGALEVGPSECVVRLFTIEVTLDQTLGNWYQFIKPIHRIKNLLTLKYLLNAVSCFSVIIFLSGLCTPLL
jgi:hypothetical protein